MNILFHAFGFKPKSGGIAEYTHQIARHLQLLGETVAVLAPEVESCKDFDTNCKYRVIRYDFQKLWNKNRVNKRCSVLRKILTTIDQNNSDIIVSNQFGDITPLDGIAAKLKSIPHYAFTHGWDVNIKYSGNNAMKRLLWLLKKKLDFHFGLKWASKVFSNSSFTKTLVENKGVKEQKTAILHPGLSQKFIAHADSIDSTKVASLKKELGVKGRSVILSLSRIVKRKGIDKTIEAMQKVKEEIPDVVYVIVGDGNYRSKLERKVSNLSLQDYVIFTGYVPSAKKHIYYAMADIFAMPSRELESGSVEGFGIVFLEANAYGKPVIAGKSGGMPDAVVNGRTGLLVNPRNVEEITNSIIKLLKNKRLMDKFGKLGKARVKEEFTWKSIAHSFRRELKQHIN